MTVDALRDASRDKHRGHPHGKIDAGRKGCGPDGLPDGWWIRGFETFCFWVRRFGETEAFPGILKGFHRSARGWSVRRPTPGHHPTSIFNPESG